MLVAGAGGAAHLPGMLASVTPLPVIGVPVPLAYLDGMDSLLSMVQMPAGVPVATVAVGGARNAGLLAVRILAASDASLQSRMTDVPGRPRRQGPGQGRDPARASAAAGWASAPDGRGQPAGPSRGHSMTGHRSMTMSSPAAVTRSAAASSITSSWNQHRLGADRDRLVGDVTSERRVDEHVDHVHREGDVRERGVGGLAEHVLWLVVHRHDPHAVPLQEPGDAMSRAHRVVPQADDGPGGRRSEQPAYDVVLRVDGHGRPRER